MRVHSCPHHCDSHQQPDCLQQCHQAALPLLRSRPLQGHCHRQLVLLLHEQEHSAALQAVTAQSAVAGVAGAVGRSAD